MSDSNDLSDSEDTCPIDRVLKEKYSPIKKIYKESQLVDDEDQNEIDQCKKYHEKYFKIFKQ